MRHFRDLLKFDPRSTPGEEQRRASEGLADAVKQSHLRWWKGRESVPCEGACLLLAVAPYSQYDLVLLDLLNEWIGSGRSFEPLLPVYVVNLLAYGSPKQLSEDFPGAGQAQQTPIAALYELGAARKVAWGKKARDMAAEVLGLAADELARRVLAESPSSANSPILRAPQSPAKA